MKSPINEMGVVALFSQYAHSLDYIIMSVQAPFPDALLYNMKTGATRTAEFEFRASNYRKHGHPMGGCDLIVCWKNDWPSCPIPILELSQYHEGDDGLANHGDALSEYNALLPEVSRVKERLRQAQDDLAKFEKEKARILSLSSAGGSADSSDYLTCRHCHGGPRIMLKLKSSTRRLVTLCLACGEKDGFNLGAINEERHIARDRVFGRMV